MPIDVRETDPDGLDYGWIMQMTFVVTILVGVPIVTILSLFTTLPTWSDRAVFAIRVGSAIWFVTLLGTFAYAKRNFDPSDDEDQPDAEPSPDDPDGQTES